MSHFYRLKTVNNFSENPPLAWRNYHAPSGELGIYHPFEKQFEEIALNPSWPHCKMFRAPLVPKDFMEAYEIFCFTGELELPDIWTGSLTTLVSQRVKDIIEANDDFEHQFLEVPVWDENQKPINQTPYYQLNVRRFLQIEDLGGKVENQFRMFRPDYDEKQYLPTIQQTPALLDHISQLPLWRHRENHGILYLSADLLNTLRAAGITGLTDYSDTYDGKTYEAVARFM
jgi:hypothetical protein